MKNKWIWLLIATIVGITIFILANSLLGFQASHIFSRWVAGLFGNPSADIEKTDMLVRKIAHVGEYALLGAVAMVLFRWAKKNKKRCSIWCVLFSLLAMGVLDEFFQSFSSRTSAVSDILLDFSGGLLGILLTTAFIKVINFVKRKGLCKGGSHSE